MSGLDDLLSGVPGFERKTLAGLKKAQAPPSTSVQASSAVGPPPPSNSSGAPRDPCAADALDALVHKSQSSPALAAQRCAAPWPRAAAAAAAACPSPPARWPPCSCRAAATLTSCPSMPLL